MGDVQIRSLSRQSTTQPPNRDDSSCADVPSHKLETSDRRRRGKAGIPCWQRVRANEWAEISSPPIPCPMDKHSRHSPWWMGMLALGVTSLFYIGRNARA